MIRRSVAQPGSAHAWGACGRWFKSSRSDHLPDKTYIDLTHGVSFKERHLWIDFLVKIK